MTPPPLLPYVGATVVYTNNHGFPRAAIITATAASLEGEQHVTPLPDDDPYAVYLHVMSPLPRTYDALSTHGPLGDPHHWSWPAVPGTPDPDPDWAELGENVLGQTITYLAVHDDGRQCVWHTRLRAYAFDGDKKCLRDNHQPYAPNSRYSTSGNQ